MGDQLAKLRKLTGQLQKLTYDLSGHPKPANEGHLKTGQR